MKDPKKVYNVQFRTDPWASVLLVASPVMSTSFFFSGVVVFYASKPIVNQPSSTHAMRLIAGREREGRPTYLPLFKIQRQRSRNDVFPGIQQAS